MNPLYYARFSKNVSYSQFCYEVARRRAKGDAVRNLLDPVFDKFDG